MFPPECSRPLLVPTGSVGVAFRSCSSVEYKPCMRCVLVSHFHWDREWYRTFEEFRSRLVVAIDRVLDLCAADPGYRFVLDGQTIVVDDYSSVRPERRAELVAAIRDGRIGVGPWYVQPDSLLPSGEAHIRNLLIGRATADELGDRKSVGEGTSRGGAGGRGSGTRK